MDEFKNINGNGSFPVNGDDNKVKIDFSNIESTESGFDPNGRFGVAEETAQEPASQQIEQPPVQKPPVQPVMQQMPAQQVPVQQKPVKPAKKGKKAADPESEKAKKEKRNKNLGTFIRVFVITVLSAITLWTVMYTVDHSFAAQGIAPLFATSSTEYTVDYLDTDKPAAFSYKCIGYKVQFLMDENYQLTQDVVWAWEDGPNDILLQRGQLFPVTNGQ